MPNWSIELNLKSGKYLLEDDGYRFYLSFLDGPAINVPKNEQMFLMEYKFPEIASDVVEEIREALEKHGNRS